MLIDRRSWITGMAALLATPRLSSAQRRFDKYPFSLGVASGDPLPDRVVLWTRLAPEPLAGGGMEPNEDVNVRWEVSADESFRRIVRIGSVTAEFENAHSVHVDVRGLEPDRWYWYRFRVRSGSGWIESPAGRTRTA